MAVNPLKLTRKELEVVFKDHKTLRQFELLIETLDTISNTTLINIETLLDAHVADGTIHFTVASIDHTAILNVGTNTHAQIDSHISDASIHFTVASIDHTAILNIGTNSHAAIDSHISDTTIHFTAASLNLAQYYKKDGSDALQASIGTILATGSTETVDASTFTHLRQTANPITTSLSGISTGSRLTIKNVGGGANTLNITVDGAASPTIADDECFDIIYNGTDWDRIS